MTAQLPARLGVGLNNLIGLTVKDLTADGASVALQIHDNHLQPDGIVHGGLYCAIVESAASMSAQVWLDENGEGRVVGVNNNTDFLRAISSGTVTAASTPIHRGRRQQLWLVTVSDETDRVVAHGQVRLQNLPQRAAGRA